MILFIIIYLGNGIITGNLKSMPVEVAFLISAFVALVINRKVKFTTKVETFCKGGGNPNIILMSLIFILAGVFSQISKDMGAVDSVVNFGLSIFSSKVLVPAIFIISFIFSNRNISWNNSSFNTNSYRTFREFRKSIGAMLCSCIRWSNVWR